MGLEDEMIENRVSSLDFNLFSPLDNVAFRKRRGGVAIGNKLEPARIVPSTEDLADPSRR